MNNQKSDIIGGLWKKTSAKTGKSFYAGDITINGEKHKIVLFENDRKPEGSNQADWHILLSTPRQGGDGGQSAGQKSQNTTPTASNSAPSRGAVGQRPSARTARPAPTQPVQQEGDSNSQTL